MMTTFIDCTGMCRKRRSANALAAPRSSSAESRYEANETIAAKIAKAEMTARAMPPGLLEHMLQVKPKLAE